MYFYTYVGSVNAERGWNYKTIAKVVETGNRPIHPHLVCFSDYSYATQLNCFPTMFSSTVFWNKPGNWFGETVENFSLVTPWPLWESRTLPYIESGHWSIYDALAGSSSLGYQAGVSSNPTWRCLGDWTWKVMHAKPIQVDNSHGSLDRGTGYESRLSLQYRYVLECVEGNAAVSSWFHSAHPFVISPPLCFSLRQNGKQLYPTLFDKSAS